MPPANTHERTPDQYHHVLPEDGRGGRFEFCLHVSQPEAYRNHGKCTSVMGSSCFRSNKLCPAVRKTDGVFVLVQLTCKGDEGQDELSILRSFSQASLSGLPENHVPSLIAELHHLDMVFAIVPLFDAEGLTCPRFFSLSEVLDAMLQTFEVLPSLSCGLMHALPDICYRLNRP